MADLPTISASLPSLVAGDPLDLNPAAVYLAGLTSNQSRRTMRSALGVIADLLLPGRFVAPGRGAPEAEREAYRNRCLWVPWAALRFQHTSAIRARLAEAYQVATANKLLAALRGTLKAAYDLGQISSEDYARATAFPSLKGESALTGRDLADEEVFALSMACRADRSPALGARDRAMIAVLWACGLRRAELVALDLADYDRQTGRLTVRSGKGRKDRTVYIRNNGRKVLESWLDLRGPAEGPLFWAIGRGGKRTGQRLTTQSVYTMLKLRARQAGLADFSPHDFRRTLVSNLLDRGADIATVAKIAGHASVTTTARYDRRREEVKSKAADLLSFPG